MSDKDVKDICDQVCMGDCEEDPEKCELYERIEQAIAQAKEEGKREGYAKSIKNVLALLEIIKSYEGIRDFQQDLKLLEFVGLEIKEKLIKRR